MVKDMDAIPPELEIVAARQEKECSRHILFRISGALHRFHRLDDLLVYVTRLIRVLMRVGGAAVIMPDDQAKEFFVRMASCDDAEAGRRLRSLRFPLGQGAAGEVYRSGKPLIVEDCIHSPVTPETVDDQTGYETRNLLDVPLRVQDHVIGLLRVLNKRRGPFDHRDVELLCSVADVVSLPIENARLKAAMRTALDQVQRLSLVKERAIHHLSHELKTPLAVLSASMSLLARDASCSFDPPLQRIHDRIERNLQRLLDVEYHLEDILRD